MSDKKPNLFIVGAAKAGTTSLHKYLDQHPDIYMAPIKEPHHFSSDINFEEFNENYKQQVRFDLKRYLTQKRLTNKHIAFIEDKEKYLELFREANNEKYFGEGSNGYLYSKVAAKEICDFNPHARIIILLRNPVDRAFSHWLMDFRNTDNDIGNFVEALEADYKGKYKGWGVSHLYVELGRYSNQVKRYLDNFPKEQIKIFLYEDFRKNNLHVLNDIFRFLGVEEKNKLEKIIYISDYIEPYREFKELDIVRKEVNKNLNKAIIIAMENTINHLKNNNTHVHIDTLKALEYLKKEERM